MASVANPIRCSVKASRFLTLCSRPIKAFPGNLVLKTRPLLSSAACSRWPEKRGIPVTGGFSGTALWTHRLRWRRPVESPAMGPAAGDSEGDVPKKKMVKKPKSSSWSILGLVHTLAYMSTWYIMGVIYILWFCVVRYLLHGACSILTKEVYNFFPYPYFVSSVHLLVGIVYWLATHCLPQQLGPPREPIDKDLFFRFVPVAACHAIGHVLYNVSLATVASSFTLTIHALEPFFNTIASGFVIGQQIPLSLWLPLAPVIIGVSMASLAELSFNWTGFIGATVSNVSLTCRSIYYKKAKAKTAMDSANVYGYISLIALLFCIPVSVSVEGPELMQHGFKDVIAKVGLRKLLSDLFWTGMLSHLAHRFATKTKVERNEPRLHAVLNALQRALGVGFSIIYFGNSISTQTGIGTAMALAGVAIYNIIRANIIVKEKREEAAAAKAAWDVKVALAKKNSNRNPK